MVKLFDPSIPSNFLILTSYAEFCQPSKKSPENSGEPITRVSSLVCVSKFFKSSALSSSNSSSALSAVLSSSFLSSLESWPSLFSSAFSSAALSSVLASLSVEVVAESVLPPQAVRAVSYTHLTLPTILLV